jgi:hypothetical protein
MMLHLKAFSKEALRVADKHQKAWENRTVFAAPKTAHPKKAA